MPPVRCRRRRECLGADPLLLSTTVAHPYDHPALLKARSAGPSAQEYTMHYGHMRGTLPPDCNTRINNPSPSDQLVRCWPPNPPSYHSTAPCSASGGEAVGYLCAEARTTLCGGGLRSTRGAMEAEGTESAEPALKCCGGCDSVQHHIVAEMHCQCQLLDRTGCTDT